MARFSRLLSWQDAVRASALFAVYFLTGKLGLKLAFDHPSATAVWAPTGIALGALVLWGLRFWPAIFLGAFFVNLTTAGSVLTSLGIAAGNTLEGVLGAWLAIRYVGGRAAFDHPVRILGWTLVAGVLATAISATIGTASLGLGGFLRWTEAGSVWQTWWLGDSGGALIAAPLIILWGREPRFRPNPRQVIEGLFAVVALLLFASISFGVPLRLSEKTYPLPFVFPLVAWAGFRLGSRGTTCISFLVAALAVWATVEGRGPFSGRSRNESLLLLQIFMSATGVTALSVAAAVAERERARREVSDLEEGRRRTAEATARRASFLAEAGAVLSSSLDYEATLAKVSELSVLRLADWCTVHVSDPRTGVRQLSVSHRDPAKVRFAHNLALKYPYDPESPRGVPQVLRTGQPEIYPHVTEDLLRAGAKDEEHFQILRDLGMVSAMVVPIRSRGRTLGAITFIATEPGRSYGPEDLSLGEALGDRAGLAIENSALYEEAKRQLEERRRSEAARALLAAAVESSEDAIITITLRGTITSWNRGAERLFGYPEAEVKGQSVLLIIPEDLRTQEMEILGRLEKGERVEQFETRRMTKDGRLLDVSLTVSPVRDDRGVLVGASKVSRDITERKRAQEEILRLKEDLEHRVEARTAELTEALSELDAFTAMASHDLRAPLRTISSFATVLVEDYASKLDDTAKNYAARIAAACERMRRLIDDLLAYSRLTKAELVPEPIDLTTLTVNIVSRLKSEIPDRTLKISIQKPLPVVRGQKVMFAQVLENLLSNAIKFVRPGTEPEIQIGVIHAGSWVRLYIRDNGIGISEEYLNRLFRPFERLPGGQEYPGVGLGLAIVKRAMERMGGKLGVESKLGRGSTFWVELPEDHL
ncbi:MAG TPA: MASE1 domain-containing protein [Planctomycetota bacterium]|nr:MASE1 domain-containing protein [Planctomycetota bacterium]